MGSQGHLFFVEVITPSKARLMTAWFWERCSVPAGLHPALKMGRTGLREPEDLPRVGCRRQLPTCPALGLPCLCVCGCDMRVCSCRCSEGCQIKEDLQVVL